MSENVFGRWKNRFPILRQLRVFLPLAQEIILATAILSNLAAVIDEPDMEDDGRDQVRGVEEPEVQVVVADNLRFDLGVAERDLHLRAMVL